MFVGHLGWFNGGFMTPPHKRKKDEKTSSVSFQKSVVKVA